MNLKLLQMPDKQAQLRRIRQVMSEGFDLGSSPLHQFLITEDREIPREKLRSEVAPIGEVREVEPDVEETPERTPYAELNFKNIVEKQQYWDTLPEKYGRGVEHRQDYLDVIDRPINIEAYRTEMGLPPFLLERMPKSHPARKDEDYVFRVDNPATQTSWRKLLEGRDDIDNKALFYASMMDEGAVRMDMDSLSAPIDGFANFGLDRITERVDEFEEKGYLPKGFSERITPNITTNEHGSEVVSAYFYNLDDAITAKNAYIKAGQDNVDSYAKRAKIDLSSKARDFFTIVSYNYGEAGARRVMKHFKDNNLLKNDKFLSKEPESYKQVYRNALRRMQAADMMVGEGFFK